MKDVVGLIPAAGKASRLGWPTAKELWPVHRPGEIVPVIQCTLDNMSLIGVNDIIIVTRPDKPEIMKYLSTVRERFESRFLNISYVCQNARNGSEGKDAGLVDAIETAYHLTKDKIVVFGMPDTVVTPESVYQPLYSLIQYNDFDLVFGLFETDTPKKFGMVEFDTLTGEVRHVFEKPQVTSLKYMWGVLVWGPQFTDLIHVAYVNQNYKFDVIMSLAIQKKLKTKAIVIPQGTYKDLGTYEDIKNL